MLKFKGMGVRRMERKILKQQAKKNLKGHYWLFVLICLIAAFLGTEFQGSLSSINSIRPENLALNSRGLEDISNWLGQLGGSIFQRNQGIFAGMVNAYYSGSFLLSIARVIEGITQSGDITLILMIIGSGLFYLGLTFFLIKPFLVIARRMILEGRHYERVPTVRLFYLFRIRKVTAVAVTLFMTNLFQLLWTLTIIGGIIKFYSYRMVPFILAENPALKSRDVITLSRQMMDGYKWQCFVLDLSFLAWEILNLLTFGIVGIFYLNPYKLSTMSEFFVRRRFDARVKEVPNSNQLNDSYLYEKPEIGVLNQAYSNQLTLQKERVEKPELNKLSAFLYHFLGIRVGNDPKLLAYDKQKVKDMEYGWINEILEGRAYPIKLNPFKEREKSLWANSHNYLKSYSPSSLILIFFIACMIGFFWEVGLHLIYDGVFVNRGVLQGPWLPIYGSGSILILTLLYRFRKHPGINFLMIVLLCGIVEYTSSWYLEMAHGGMKWWDYSGYFLNLNGRVSGEGLLVFGLGGLAVVYVVAPVLDALISRISRKNLIALCCILLCVFSIDQLYSSKNPNMGEGVTDYASRIQRLEPLSKLISPTKKMEYL